MHPEMLKLENFNTNMSGMTLGLEHEYQKVSAINW